MAITPRYGTIGNNACNAPCKAYPQSPNGFGTHWLDVAMGQARDLNKRAGHKDWKVVIRDAHFFVVSVSGNRPYIQG